MACVHCGNDKITEDMVDMGSICVECFHDPVSGRKINDYGFTFTPKKEGPNYEAFIDKSLSEYEA